MNLAQNMSSNLSDVDDLLKRNKELEDKSNKLLTSNEEIEKKYVALKLSMSQVIIK